METKYTDRDYDAYFELFKEKARNRFPQWKNFSLSNVGVFFLELLATIGDSNAWYLNRNTNEAIFITASSRRNINKHLKRMNYIPRQRTPASVDLRFTLTNGVQTKDVIIPKNYQVKTADEQFIFETTETATITAGDLFVDVVAKNWVSQTETLDFTGDSNQEIFLKNENVIDDEDEIILEIESIYWNLKPDDLLDSDSTDRGYVLEYDDELRAILRFGDGVHGAIPSGSGNIYYKTGGGSDANNIDVDTITSLSDPIYDIDSDEIEIELTNPLSPSGGEDEEEIDEIKIKAPKERRKLNSTVGRDDYEAHSELVDGVARALALGKQEDPTIPNGYIYVYIVPEGGGSASGGLIAEVESYLLNEKPIMHTSHVSILQPVYLDITIAGSVIKKSEFTQASVKNAVDNALINYFSYYTVEDNNGYTINFGYYKDTIYLSTIIDVIMNAKVSNLKCVESVTLTLPAANVSIAQKEMPNLLALNNLVVS